LREHSHERPFFSYTAERKTHHHYAPQTRADMCDNKPRRVTYVAGNPDARRRTRQSAEPFEDNIDALWIAIGPRLFPLAAPIGSSPGRRSGAPARRRGW
jgi:hypothetical protein